MRIGFRRQYLKFVVYLRENWSIEIWVGRYGLYYSRKEGLIFGKGKVIEPSKDRTSNSPPTRGA